ncbi:uncharacterized protein DKFZp434B061-like [Talpa occidentalis]|uniref:uncharacterized protein DKFZp434B061-like n=1 Tax=Talpa occidentalis TaxID=50954 RepID=UPI00188EB922|nr:uncharacterized protein DKFZp434B061-like [Talpa occidentalis]
MQKKTQKHNKVKRQRESENLCHGPRGGRPGQAPLDVQKGRAVGKHSAAGLAQGGHFTEVKRGPELEGGAAGQSGTLKGMRVDPVHDARPRRAAPRSLRPQRCPAQPRAAPPGAPPRRPGAARPASRAPGQGPAREKQEPPRRPPPPRACGRNESPGLRPPKARAGHAGTCPSRACARCGRAVTCGAPSRASVPTRAGVLPPRRSPPSSRCATHATPRTHTTPCTPRHATHATLTTPHTPRRWAECACTVGARESLKPFPPLPHNLPPPRGPRQSLSAAHARVLAPPGRPAGAALRRCPPWGRPCLRGPALPRGRKLLLLLRAALGGDARGRAAEAGARREREGEREPGEAQGGDRPGAGTRRPGAPACGPGAALPARPRGLRTLLRASAPRTRGPREPRRARAPASPLSPAPAPPARAGLCARAPAPRRARTCQADTSTHVAGRPGVRRLPRLRTRRPGRGLRVPRRRGLRLQGRGREPLSAPSTGGRRGSNPQQTPREAGSEHARRPGGDGTRSMRRPPPSRAPRRHYPQFQARGRLRKCLGRVFPSRPLIRCSSFRFR